VTQPAQYLDELAKAGRFWVVSGLGMGGIGLGCWKKGEIKLRGPKMSQVSMFFFVSSKIVGNYEHIITHVFFW
jgi:hypothetical protein